jgi:hypothetical protein
MNEREQRIREIAHRLWEEEGSPWGRDNEFWARAERMLAEEEKGGPPPIVPPQTAP